MGQFIQRDSRTNRLPLLIILAVFLAFCLANNFAVPLFEGNDEGDHFLYVNYIATNRALPDMNQSWAISHEIVQPPLYYVVSSLFVGLTDRSDLKDVYRQNKDREIFFFDHTNAEIVFPPQGTTLAMRINRLVSTLFGMAGILLIYHIVLILYEHEPVALLAAGLTAFNPKYVQMSSLVGNDIAVAAAGALTLFCLARLLRQSGPVQKRQVVMVSATVGLAYLCKTNGLALLLPVAAVLIYISLRDEKGKPFMQAIRNAIAPLLRYAILCVAGFLLVAGWYLAYCEIRYGNPLVWFQLQAANTALRRAAPLSIMEMVGTIPEIIKTYWNIFRQDIQWSPALDTFFIVIDCIAVVGLCIKVIRRQSRIALGLLLLTLLAAVIALVPWLRDYQKTENVRLLAPSFAVLPPLLAVGLLEWFPRRMWRPASYAIPAIAAMSTCAIIGFVLIPTYDIPHYLTAGEVQALPADGRVLFDNGIEMMHASLSNNRLSPGDGITLTVYWHATTFIKKPYQVSIETFSQDGTSLDRQTIEPFNGRLDTARWGTGVLRDEYHLQYKPVDKQTVAKIYIGWVEYDPPHQVSHLAGSTAESAQIGEIKLRGARQPELSPTYILSSTLGNEIGLEGYDLSGNSIRLYWRSLGMPNQDYSVFVHAMDQQGKLIAQSDQLIGYHTSLWDPGEQVIDEHLVTGLSRAASIQVGIYDSRTGARLHAVQANGVAWPDDSVVIKHGD
jgi:hypothetical protein